MWDWLKNISTITQEETDMYINPFVAGVLATIFAEMAALIVYAVVKVYWGGKL